MSAGLTIRADGMEWPLETYLDARGFIRVDPFALPSLGGGYMGDPRVEIVTHAGELQPERYASSVMWRMCWRFALWITPASRAFGAAPQPMRRTFATIARRIAIDLALP